MHAELDTEHARGLPVPQQSVRLGAAFVQLARRRLEGPGGSVMLEPRMLTVLLALVAARGEVVSRDELLDVCWPGTVVGVDSLHRAVAELRKALRSADAGVRIETIPRTGYRLSDVEPADSCRFPVAADPNMAPEADRPGASPTGDHLAVERPLQAETQTEDAHAAGSRSTKLSRRKLIEIASVASVSVASLAGLAHRKLRSLHDEAQADALMEEAQRIFREDRWGVVDPAALLREVIALRPDDARAWGLYALVFRDIALSSSDQVEFGAAADCRLAAKKALLLNPVQPEAQVALATLDPYYTDWLGAEHRIAPLLARFPNSEAVLNSMAELYLSTGRAPESLVVSRRLNDLVPQSPQYASMLVLALWDADRISEMDTRADAALQTWPGNEAVWCVRMVSFGFTGRAKRALEMIDQRGDAGPHPPLVADAIVAALKYFAGVDSMEAAIGASLSAAARRQSSATRVIPILAGLGAVDQAFAVAYAYFLGRGPFKVPFRFARAEPSVREMRHRETACLFKPGTRTLWSDSRFATLCEQIGMTSYWRAVGVFPRFMKGNL